LVSDWSSDVCSSDLSHVVGVEKEPVEATRIGGAQVDQEDDLELQSLGAVDGEHAHRVGGFDLGLADRYYRLHDPVQMSYEIGDAGETGFAFETRGHLEDFAQVQNGPGTLASGTELAVAEVSGPVQETV